MGWEQDLEAKHDKPLDDIAGTVYVLHYEVPQTVKSVSGDYAARPPRSDADGFLSATPIRHYVGWTQQRLPRKRINRHGPAALRQIVYQQPGTTQDEQAMKLTGTCPSAASRWLSPSPCRLDPPASGYLIGPRPSGTRRAHQLDTVDGAAVLDECATTTTLQLGRLSLSARWPATFSQGTAGPTSLPRPMSDQTTVPAPRTPRPSSDPDAAEAD